MMHPIKKRRFPWRGVPGFFLLTFLALSCMCNLVRAEDGREGIIDGRNPADFNGTGRIESLEKDRIVINDTPYRLSPRVKYYKQGRKRMSRSSFKEGTHVGYVTNSKREIFSLCLIPETRRTPRRP